MQQLVIENLELRVSSISSDLEPDEQAQLRSDLNSLSTEYRTLCTGVRSYENELDKTVGERQNFEAQMDDTRRKLAALVVQSQGYELLPLSSSATEKIAEKFKVQGSFLPISELHSQPFPFIGTKTSCERL